MAVVTDYAMKGGVNIGVLPRGVYPATPSNPAL
jgi:hypothetical protein